MGAMLHHSAMMHHSASFITFSLFFYNNILTPQSWMRMLLNYFRIVTSLIVHQNGFFSIHSRNLTEILKELHFRKWSSFLLFSHKPFHEIDKISEE